MSVISLSQSDNGKSIQIRVGNLVVIQLRENPTTGYQWTFNQSNQQVLAFQGTEYTPSAATGVGGGGQRVFRFKGERAGTTELDFKLWRQWQGEQSTIDRFTTTIQVEG
ncbi:MAG: protease inhibitor I42 family protein [Leptolyngbyaceae cyanobacterium]